jgi:hypothetical protein
MILGRLAGGGGWIQVAQDRDRWRAVMNAVMNTRVIAPRLVSYAIRYCCVLRYCIIPVLVFFRLDKAEKLWTVITGFLSCRR